MPNVRVVVRCRPLQNQAEHERWVVQPSSISLRGEVTPASSSGYDKTFSFDRVYHGKEPQQNFFESEIAPLITQALAISKEPNKSVVWDDEKKTLIDNEAKGEEAPTGPVNVVIFAYGQTGSGKTYTVDGVKASVPLAKPDERKKVAMEHAKEEEETKRRDANEDGVEGEAQSTSSDGSENEDEEAARTAGEGVAPRTIRMIFREWEAQTERLKLAFRQKPKLSPYSPSPPPGSPHAPPPSSSEPPADSSDAPQAQFRRNSAPPLSTSDAKDESAIPPYELTQISVSFLEVYNEKLFDLLNATRFSDAGSSKAQKFLRNRRSVIVNAVGSNAACLRLRRCPDAPGRLGPAKFEVENLTKISCISSEEALEYYYFGVSKKIFRGHNLNSQSSRAHSIFTVYLTFRDNTSNDSTTGTSESSFVSAEIAVVDLAGSERLNSILPGHNAHNHSSTGGSSSSAATQQQGHSALISESIHINKSLLTLGKVIVALSDAKMKQDKMRGRPSSSGDANSYAIRYPHTPYRDSKLTMVINHALGGNAVTLMVACMHLDPAQASESLSTLFYASRTNKIANSVKTVEDPKTTRIRALVAEVASLRLELGTANDTIASLRKLLAMKEGTPMTAPVPMSAMTSLAPVAWMDSAGEPPLSAPPTERRSSVPSISNENHTPPRRGVEALQEKASPESASPAFNLVAQKTIEELSEKLREACVKLKTVLDANARLRNALDESRQRSVVLEREREMTEQEQAKLREKLDLYDALLLAQIAINKEYDSPAPGGERRKARSQSNSKRDLAKKFAVISSGGSKSAAQLYAGGSSPRGPSQRPKSATTVPTVQQSFGSAPRPPIGSARDNPRDRYAVDEVRTSTYFPSSARQASSRIPPPPQEETQRRQMTPPPTNGFRNGLPLSLLISGSK